MLTNLDPTSQLLLYVADELSAADRLVVERGLAENVELKAEFDRMNEAMEGLESGMAALDSLPLPVESVVTRRIGQQMRQRLADRARPMKPVFDAPRQLRYPAWAYPVAGAAVVALAMLGWWGHLPDAPLHDNSPRPAVAIGSTPKTGVPASEKPAAGDDVALDDSRNSDDVVSSLDENNPTQPAQRLSSLEAAEGQLADLTRSTSQIMPSGLSFRDSNE